MSETACEICGLVQVLGRELDADDRFRARLKKTMVQATGSASDLEDAAVDPWSHDGGKESFLIR